jgi:hypothetical protein
MAALTTLRPPPGVRCPACGAGSFDITDAAGRAGLTCGRCGVLVRLLRRRGDPQPACEPCPPGASRYAQDAPPPGSWWLGFVRSADGQWRPVALAATLGGCWDALLGCTLDGDMLLAPTDPLQPDRPLPQKG